MMKDKKKIILSVLGVLLVIIATVGVTYAFFNYTRTGQANTISTGRIAFNTIQGNTLNITDVFPLTSTEAANANLQGVT